MDERESVEKPTRMDLSTLSIPSRQAMQKNSSEQPCQPQENPFFPSSLTKINPFNFEYVFSVLFLHTRQGTSEFHVYAFEKGQYRFRRANIDSGGPIRIQEGQYEFSRANTEPSFEFRNANSKPSIHFRRANMETY